MAILCKRKKFARYSTQFKMKTDHFVLCFLPIVVDKLRGKNSDNEGINLKFLFYLSLMELRLKETLKKYYLLV